MGDVEDVHMESQHLPMSLGSPTIEEKFFPDSDSEYSGDEPEDDEDVTRNACDDIDASPFTWLYNKLVGRSREREHSRPEAKVREVYSPDDFEYKFTYPNRGLAVIINNEKFRPGTDMSVRFGSGYDATDLELIYKRMGFKVKRYNDLTGHQMVLKLKKLAANLKYDHTKADCFSCAILSHGDAVEFDPEAPPYDVKERHDVVFGIDGIMVPTRYILSLFNDRHCPELEGKPRMFFIQACRGTDFDDGLDVKVWKTKSTYKKKRAHGKDAGDSTDSVPCKKMSGNGNLDHGEITLPEGEGQGEGQGIDDCDAGRGSSDITICPSPIYKDFLVMYSSPPGYFAWRRSTGAWFIQSLKQVILTSDLSATPLSKLLTKVSSQVALTYQSKSDKTHWKDGKKQVPCVMSMLCKDVYFRPKH